MLKDVEKEKTKGGCWPMCWKMLCCMAKTCYLEEVRDVEKMLVQENALHYGLDFLFGASKAEMLKKMLVLENALLHGLDFLFGKSKAEMLKHA